MSTAVVPDTSGARDPLPAPALPPDPLTRARVHFLDGLATRLMRVVDSLERWRQVAPAAVGDDDLLLARRELHTLCGTAGTLGYVGLAAAAAALHALLGSVWELRDAPSADTIDDALDALLAIVITTSMGPITQRLAHQGHAPATILVVDDDCDLLAITSARLDSEGFATASFDDGARALRALDDIAPDVAVLDWTMPAMDGATLLGRIRGLPGFRTLPVIVFSSNDTEADQVLMRAAGADETVSKAAPPDALLAAVHRQLQRMAHLAGPRR